MGPHEPPNGLGIGVGDDVNEEHLVQGAENRRSQRVAAPTFPPITAARRHGDARMQIEPVLARVPTAERRPGTSTAQPTRSPAAWRGGSTTATWSRHYTQQRASPRVDRSAELGAARRRGRQAGSTAGAAGLGTGESPTLAPPEPGPGVARVGAPARPLVSAGAGRVAPVGRRAVDAAPTVQFVCRVPDGTGAPSHPQRL